MGGEWSMYRVSDLIAEGALTINDGYRAKNSELSNHGYPFARAGNIKNGFHFDGADHFPEENLYKVGQKISQVGDVVFTSKGTVGRFAFVTPKTKRFVYSPQLCFWRSNDQNIIASRYLYYWMHSSEFLHQFTGVKGQTDMADYVSLRDQRAMKLTLPTIDTQESIAHILGSLDDKIEVNRQLNQTLEQVAQAIFKSWFIDFDPVVYNAVRAGNPVPERFQATADRYRKNPDIQTLPQHILDLFPDRFEDSELGEIPAEWDSTTVGEMFDVTMGQSPPGSTYNEEGEGLPFFQGRRDFSFRFPGYRVFCSEPKRIANAGDTLISVRAPVGDINMAQTKSCIGRGVAAVRHKSGYRSFTYYSMQSLGEHFLSYEGEGTVFGSINKKQFSKLPHTSPPQATIDSFESLVSGLDDQIENNLIQEAYLAKFRDTLLPKLISGELRVLDPESYSVGVA